MGLVIELDGGQHAQLREKDAARTRFLEERGFRVLRFWDNDVLLNLDAVLERIAEALRDPHPDPLPGREGEEENPRPRREGEEENPRPRRGRGEGEGEF